mmetsp:Transcript_41885/g.56938  ORF Transcript_41885/g.56938 Transcript_41885/m.56938 type:complete len:90 (+) Transcript_41885:92-361(+)
MVESAEANKELNRKNWADEEEDDNEAQDQEIGDSAADQKQQQEAQKEEAKEEAVEEVKPTWKMVSNDDRQRNQFGDFVVKKIEVKDPRS